MKRVYSIKLKFIFIYFFSFVIPIIVSMLIISSYLKVQFTKQISVLIDDHLEAISQNISSYLEDLNGITTMPYYNKDFITYLDTVLKNNAKGDSEYERFLAEVALKDELSNYMLLTRKDILGTILVTDKALVSGVRKDANPYSLHDYDFSKTDWYIEAMKCNGRPYVTGVHSQDYFPEYSDTKVFSVARLIKDPVTSRNLGVMMADANTNIFNDVFSNIKFNIPSKILLLDKNNNVIYSTGDISKDMIKKLNNNNLVKDGKESYIVKIRDISNYDWKIVMFISDNSIKKQLSWIYGVCALLLLLGLAVTYFVFYLLSGDISMPIKKMMKAMKEVEKGNFNVRVSEFKIFEINELSRALNNMTEKLNESIEKEYKLVIQQKNAEFKALQSQIHPHFLYNTLNGFIGLNRLGEKQRLEDSILNLTKMLRYALEDRDLVSIKEEFDFLREYGDLQLIRFEDRLKINISCDERIKEYIIPKFLLQPIVENAMVHGAECSENLCTLNILGSLDDNNVIFNVSDDGVGFKLEASKEGVGLSNIKNRLLLFNKNSKFHMESSPNKGTHIVIMIPVEDFINENSDC